MPSTQQLHAAVDLSRFAELAYSIPSTIASRLNHMGYRLRKRDIHFINHKPSSTQGFAFATRREIVICFRGTEPASLRDWMSNANFDLDRVDINGENYRVFDGFWQNHNKVWPGLQTWLNTKLKAYHDASLFLTGHSLGGALACLTLAKCMELDIMNRVGGLYTFGSPRCVGEDLAATLNSQVKDKVLRFINDQDVVPHLPPDIESVKPMDYGHFGQLVWFDAAGHANYQDTHGYWQTAKRQVDDSSLVSQLFDHALSNIFIVEKVSDHFNVNYRKLCRECFSQFSP